MAILAILALMTVLFWVMIYLLFGGTDDDDHTGYAP